MGCSFLNPVISVICKVIGYPTNIDWTVLSALAAMTEGLRKSSTLWENIWRPGGIS